MKRVGGCTVPLADWPLFHCIGQVVGGGEGGGLWGLLRINYEGLKFHLCLKGACVVSLVHASTFTYSSWLP